jgi:hypothetical protein
VFEITVTADELLDLSLDSLQQYPSGKYHRYYYETLFCGFGAMRG